MMIISPLKSLNGEFTVPGDKSISHRAIMLASIAKGRSEINGFLNSDDCLNTISCFRALGIGIELLSNNKVYVEGKGLYGLKKADIVLNVGNSGTSIRLLLGLLAGQNFETIIDGDSSIRNRPMDRVIIPLSQMGANIKSINKNNLCPLKVSGGKLRALNYKLPIASAQLKSALLLASLYADGETILTELAASRNHSELMLNYFGANITTKGLNVYSKPVTELYSQNINIPGDISSAAYFIVAGLIVPNSQIIIKNVGINQSRTGIIDVLIDMGANITIANRKSLNNEPVGDIIVKSSSLKSTIIKDNIIPRLIDELPIIAVAAALSTGKTIIKDAGELKVKESNRITAVVTELSKTGIDIKETNDGMIINGGKEIMGADFNTYNDHRIAMMVAVLALVARSDSKINGADIVNVSFPNFFELLFKL